MQVWLFLWPEPLSPAKVTIEPELADVIAIKPDLPVSIKVDAAESLVDALGRTLDLPSERVLPLLSALAMLCLSAHQIDERDLEDEDDEDEDEDEDED